MLLETDGQLRTLMQHIKKGGVIMEDNKVIEVIQKYIDKKIKKEIGRRISKGKKEK